MLPPAGSICGKLTKDVPLGCLQGGPMEKGSYRGSSLIRTRTALGSYGRAMPSGIGPPYGQCVSLFTSNPCNPCNLALAHK
jgi:hypothetical protein